MTPPTVLSDAAAIERLEKYLAAQLGTSLRVRNFHRFPGGLSWISAGFQLETTVPHALDGQRLIVKIGAPTGLMAPYSSAPQASVLSALALSNVPIPNVRWWSDDEDLVGAPFIITDFVDGVELNPFVRDYGIRDDHSALPWLGAELAKALAAIHSFDWRASGIRTLQGESPDLQPGASQAQFWIERVRRWRTGPTPLLEYAAQWLVKHCPPSSFPAAIVHGDFRVGNFLAVGNRITAVLDWEMTHLGDPHEDLAWVLLPELRLDGLIPAPQFLDIYAAASGSAIDQARLRYYGIFSLFKMACINTGGLSGFANGSGDLRLACVSFNIPMYLDRLGAALRQHS
ncbi:phosphotransferase family protein [Bradyrhizobium liaoningense]